MATTGKLVKHLTSFDFELDKGNATLRALNTKAANEMKKHVGPDLSVIHDRTIDINPFSMDDLQSFIEGDGWKVRVVGASASAVAA